MGHRGARGRALLQPVVHRAYQSVPLLLTLTVYCALAKSPRCHSNSTLSNRHVVLYTIPLETRLMEQQEGHDHEKVPQVRAGFSFLANLLDGNSAEAHLNLRFELRYHFFLHLHHQKGINYVKLLILIEVPLRWLAEGYHSSLWVSFRSRLR